MANVGVCLRTTFAVLVLAVGPVAAGAFASSAASAQPGSGSGSVASFGDAATEGGPSASQLVAPVVGMAATPGGGGYWLVAADGGVFSFGRAAFHGSMGAAPANPSIPAVGMAAPDGAGYWVTTTAKALPAPTPVPSVLAECNRPGAGPAVEPTNIVLACGDGNASLTGLAWSSWGVSSATGSGEYTHNLCVPNCASGTFVSTPTSVELRYPVRSAAGSEFSTVTYSAATPTAPGGRTTYSAVVETSGY